MDLRESQAIHSLPPTPSLTQLTGSFFSQCFCFVHLVLVSVLDGICRYEDPQNVIRKKNIAPVPAYENWIESQTVQDLQAIRFNHNSIHMESLTIRERILTTKCPDVAHPIVFRGAVCADNGRFDRCESLWLHALELRQNNNVSI